MPRHSPNIPVVHAVPVERRQPLDLNVAIVCLGFVLIAQGVLRFLLLFGAVLVFDRRLNPVSLVRKAFRVAGCVGDWFTRCLPSPPAEVVAAVAPPEGLVLAAQALGEMLDEIFDE